MDSIKLTLFLVLSLQSGFVLSQSVFFDMGEHSGFVRGSDGHYAKFSSNGSVRSLTSNTALALLEKPVLQTSKGAFEVTLNRAAAVDVSRVGKAVRGLALLGGPVGLSLTAASLVCELTTICEQAGQWMMGSDPGIEGYPSGTDTVGYYYVAGINSSPYRYPTASIACSSAAGVFWGEGKTGSGSGVGGAACTVTTTSDGSSFQTSIAFSTGSCPENYLVNGSSCALQGNSTPTVPTAQDWDAKQSLLNDDRFVPELFDKGASIPVSTPTFSGSSPVISSMGSTTKTLKDGAGNVTGTEVTTDILTVTDAATAENPNRMSVTQSTITNTYNTSNVLTGSTTTVTEPLQPPPKTENIEVEFDAMTDQPLETQEISAVFSHTSWGSGSCPADREIKIITMEPLKGCLAAKAAFT